MRPAAEGSIDAETPDAITVNPMLGLDTLEPFARYEWIGPDGDRGFNDMNLITAGMNYYLRKHAAFDSFLEDRE